VPTGRPPATPPVSYKRAATASASILPAPSQPLPAAETPATDEPAAMRESSTSSASSAQKTAAPKLGVIRATVESAAGLPAAQGASTPSPLALGSLSELPQGGTRGLNLRRGSGEAGASHASDDDDGGDFQSLTPRTLERLRQYAGNGDNTRSSISARKSRSSATQGAMNTLLGSSVDKLLGGSTSERSFGERLVDSLQRIPMFEGAAFDQLVALCRAATFRTYARHNVIYREGSTASWTCVLLHGTVATQDERKFRVELSRTSADQPALVFGEEGGAVLPLIRFNTCTAVADDTIVMIVKREDVPESSREVLQQAIKVHFLQRAPLLNLRKPADALAAAPLFELQFVQVGQVVLRQDHAADSLYVFISGRLDVSILGSMGVPVVVGALASHDNGVASSGVKVFGEAALTTNGTGKRAATVSAADPCYVLRLEKQHFARLIELVPDIRQRCVQAAAVTELSNLAKKHAEDQARYSRLLNYLRIYNDTSASPTDQRGPRRRSSTTSSQS